MRRRLVELGLLLAGFAIVLAPWVARNVASLGELTLSSRAGVNLIRRSPRAAEPLSAYPAWLIAAAWIATNPVSNLVYPIGRFQWGDSYEDNAIWDFHVNDMVRYNSRYEPVCQPRPDPDACYANIGLAFIRAYPIGYAAQSLFALVLLLFAPLPGPQAWLHNGIVWLGLISIGGLLWRGRPRLNGPRLLMLLVLGAYVGVSILVDTQVRYLLPVLPLFAIFGGLPVAALLHAAWRRAPLGPRLRAMGRWVVG
jgi:hypothetical protein